MKSGLTISLAPVDPGDPGNYGHDRQDYWVCEGGECRLLSWNAVLSLVHERIVDPEEPLDCLGRDYWTAATEILQDLEQGVEIVEVW